MKEWKPIFIENSKLPVVLSYFSPITIGAITLGFFVFSRDEMTERTKRHETIHFQQFLELGFVFFLLLYFYYWLRNILKGLSGSQAYYEIPFEREAYENDDDEEYLQNRERYAWRKRT